MKPDAYYLHNSATLRDALDALNRLAVSRTLFVVDEKQRLLGTFTDGDARRAILAGITLEDSVLPHVHGAYKSIRQTGFQPAEVAAYCKQGVQLLPLLDDVGRIIRLYDLTKGHAVLPLDAVIMAGGRGQRLAPLTDTLPKPLLLVGDKPIIEHNVDRLIHCGIDRITISVRYLGGMLEAHFGDGSDRDIAIDYIREEDPLGTMGCLSLLPDTRYDSLLVMNSDLLTTIDFADMYRSFTEQQADLMVASIPYKVDIPYAILETEESRIRSFSEKPTYTYFSNAGIYLLKKALLDRIPSGKPFDATDLMSDVIATGGLVAHYPILGYWLDIGKPEDYAKAQEDIKHLNL